MAGLPFQIAAHFLGAVWLWIGLPVGVAYGVAAYLISSRLAGRPARPPDARTAGHGHSRTGRLRARFDLVHAAGAGPRGGRRCAGVGARRRTGRGRNPQSITNRRRCAAGRRGSPGSVSARSPWNWTLAAPPTSYARRRARGCRHCIRGPPPPSSPRPEPTVASTCTDSALHRSATSRDRRPEWPCDTRRARWPDPLQRPLRHPEEDRSAVRRLRGRLAAPVTLWTAPGPAGLTVSSMLVADGEPGPGARADRRGERLLGGGRGGRPVRGDAARPRPTGSWPTGSPGLMPAPGGLFADRRLDRRPPYGPVPAHAAPGPAAGWRAAGRAAGRCWSRAIDRDGRAGRRPPRPLVHYRGRYRTATSTATADRSAQLRRTTRRSRPTGGRQPGGAGPSYVAGKSAPLRRW